MPADCKCRLFWTKTAIGRQNAKINLKIGVITCTQFGLGKQITGLNKSLELTKLMQNGKNAPYVGVFFEGGREIKEDLLFYEKYLYSNKNKAED